MKKVIKYFFDYFYITAWVILLLLLLPFMLLLSFKSRKEIAEKLAARFGYIPKYSERMYPNPPIPPSLPSIFIEIDGSQMITSEAKVYNRISHTNPYDTAEMFKRDLEYNLFEEVKKYIIWREEYFHDHKILSARLFIHPKKQQQS